MSVIKNPESTKNKSTPTHPNLGTGKKEKLCCSKTPRIANPLSPSRAG
jgi:hypothetical protein